MATAVLLLLTSGVFATGPFAPSRASPSTPATLERLADALGRTHGLHRVRAGPSDDLWRGRMRALLDAEDAVSARRVRLITTFNLGYAEAATGFSTCTPQARAGLVTAARAGRDAAIQLAAGDS